MVGVDRGFLVHSSCSVRFNVKAATASLAQHILVIANRPAAWKLVGSSTSRSTTLCRRMGVDLSARD
jgi:hypothetical protein